MTDDTTIIADELPPFTPDVFTIDGEFFTEEEYLAILREVNLTSLRGEFSQRFMTGQAYGL